MKTQKHKTRKNKSSNYIIRTRLVFFVSHNLHYVKSVSTMRVGGACVTFSSFIFCTDCANNCLALSLISVFMLICTAGCLGCTKPPRSNNCPIRYDFVFSDVFSSFIRSIATSTRYGIEAVILSLAICKLLFNCSFTHGCCNFL